MTDENQEETRAKTKKLILDTVDDLVGGFMYYDRKEDPELERGDIEKAIESGIITIDEIVERFKSKIDI